MASSSLHLRLGTRGSALALWQAGWVSEQLKSRYPHINIETVIIKTAGDLRSDIPLAEVSGQGIFVSEIESALRDGRIDIAVHSAKDLPSGDSEGLIIASFCERADPRDALISPAYGKLSDLPAGARVATGSTRRIAQLSAVRPDLRFVSIRGNVDTRVAKLEAGEADALVLAVAGLARLGRQSVITETLEPEVCLPQVGQGCVVVQCRSDEADVIAMVADACDHAATRREVSCERRFLSLIGGGCSSPIAAYGISSDRFLYLFAMVSTPDGRTVLRTRSGSVFGNAMGVAEGAYRSLLDQGAGSILEVSKSGGG